jgi:uncharacterized damage-inducible protein DinB
MKNAVAVLLLVVAGTAYGQTQPAPTMKSLLLAQLKTTHNVQDWFVPVLKALDGVTAEQAMWKDGNANHSIAQLVSHLTFWNRQQLAKFKGETPSAFSGNNDETFSASVDPRGWETAVRQLDDVLTAWERAIESADDARLQSWYSTIAHISTHNAYHTGQILYIRKQQGSWDAAKGVK